MAGRYYPPKRDIPEECWVADPTPDLECSHPETFPANDDGEIVCRRCWEVIR